MSNLYISGFKECVNYTIEVLTAGILLKEGKVCDYISYSSVHNNNTTPNIRIVPSNFFKQGVYATKKSLPEQPMKFIDKLPLLFGIPKVEYSEESLVIYADIIASSYFLLTRYEEIIRSDVRDIHGRFLGKYSILYSGQLFFRPLVDEYSSLIEKWLELVGVKLIKSEKKLSVTLTHDVDYYSKYKNFKQFATNSIEALKGKNGKFHEVINHIGVVIGLKQDPYLIHNFILKMDLKIKSNVNINFNDPIFFFMASSKGEHDGMYNIKSKRIIRTIKALVSTGAQVGLHSSYKSGKNPENIVLEKKLLENTINTKIVANRFHFLCWREVKDIDAIIQAGFKNDFTLGYPDIPGFRLGVCKPIPYFNPIKKSITSLIVHPMSIMDVSLSDSKYLNLRYPDALELSKTIIDEIKKYGGELVTLWHNTELSSKRDKYHFQLYGDIIGYLGSL